MRKTISFDFNGLKPSILLSTNDRIESIEMLLFNSGLSGNGKFLTDISTKHNTVYN